MPVELSHLAGPDGGDKGRRLAKYWLNQIAKVDAENKRFLKRGRAIEKRYRDERNRSEEEGQRRMNNLWANTQIMLPALYGQCPVPIAERRFRDRDPVGRSAAQIIERALRNDLDFDDFHDSVSSAVLDFLLPGRGVCWARYEPEIGQGISIPVDGQNDLRDDEGEIESDDESEEEIKLEETEDRLVRESVPIDYICWEDFYMFPAKARTWKEVRAIGKRCYLSRDELAERFGEEIADEIPLQKEDKERRDTAEGKATTEHNDDKAHVIEIWDKDHEQVVWVADGYEYLCNEVPDPLELEHFFPVPKPLTANATNTSIVPVPDYIQYQDQARQIDELTQRISQLAKACKIAGTYNAASDEIARLLDESVENELIPVDNWTAFAEKNGIQGQISLLPIDTIVKALGELVNVKKMTIEEMDRLTGITDVLRGVTTDARETLGKGKLNNNNGKSRLRDRQDEVARFARDLIRIKAEIMCKHFRNKSLIDASGVLYEEGLGIADVMHYSADDASVGAPSPPMAGPQPGAGPNQPGAAFPAPGVPAAPAGPPGVPAGPGTPPPAGAPQPGGPMTPYGPLTDEMTVLKALQRIQSALRLLRDDHARGFRIDIEVDSTIVGDEEADKEQRTEFIQAVTMYLEKAGQLAMAQPLIVPLLGKLLQFAVRGFRVGRDLEQAIEEFCDQAAEQAKQLASQPKPPSPEAVKAQTEQLKQKGELQRIQAQGQVDRQQAMADQQTEAMRAHADQTQSQADIRLEEMRMQMEQLKGSIEAMKLQFEAQAAVRDHHMAMTRPLEPSTPAAGRA